MYRLKPVLNNKALVNMYYAFIHSHLCYGILAWGGAATSNLTRLKSLQRRAFNLIYDTTNVSVDRNKILSVENLYKYFCGVKVYKCLHGEGSDRTMEYALSSAQPSHSYSTRHRELNNLNVPLFNLTRCQQSLIFNACIHWNNIPFPIRESESVHNFKKCYRDYLLL